MGFTSSEVKPGCTEECTLLEGCQEISVASSHMQPSLPPKNQSLNRHSKPDLSLYFLLARQLLITPHRVAGKFWSMLTALVNPDNEAGSINC